MRDYSERRQSRTAATAAPKRPSIWPSVFLVFFLVTISFTAGLGTGWYLLRPGGRFYKAPKMPPAPAAVAPTAAALPPQGQPVVPHSQTPGQPASEKSTGAPPLTFYDTLQKGNKGLMGTGINQPKEPHQAAPAASQPAQPGH